MLGINSKTSILSPTFIIAFVALFLMACSSPEPLNREHLDPQNPLGLGWQTSNAGVKISQITTRRLNTRISNCKKKYNRLEKFLNGNFTDEYLEYCKSSILVDEGVLRKELPRFFRDSSISVTRNHKFDPVMYEYSYGHEIGPAHTLQKTRIEKYNFLKTELVELLGEPQLWGDIWEYGDSFFIHTEKEKASCSVWVKNSIAIYLCSERIKYIDGVETSLIFLDMENHPYGKSIAKELRIILDINPSRSQSKFLGSEEHLSALLLWTGETAGTDFPGCQKDGNIPLTERAKVSADTIKLLQPLLSKYSGQSLMEYMYEHVIEIEEIVPDANIENVITYLIFTAAQDGSGGAYNEIGASLLYCYQDVQQNYDEAILWFEKAIAKKEPLAYRSKALLHIMGKTDSIAPRKEAMELLERCSEIDPEACSAELAALKWVERLHSE